MQGRFAPLAKAIAATVCVWIVAGCEPPRVKSIESTVSATSVNPPRDFKKEPLDPHSWGGIAAATGGREPRTTYGALSPSGNDGVDEVFLPVSPNAAVMKQDSQKTYLVPDPRRQNKVGQYAASRYLDNEGHDVVKAPSVINAHPPRAGLVTVEHDAPASGESAGH